MHWSKYNGSHSNTKYLKQDTNFLQITIRHAILRKEKHLRYLKLCIKMWHYLFNLNAFIYRVAVRNQKQPTKVYYKKNELHCKAYILIVKSENHHKSIATYHLWSISFSLTLRSCHPNSLESFLLVPMCSETLPHWEK